MGILLFYLLFVGLIGYAANSKGRSAIGWALIAFVLSPIIAGFFLLLMSDARNNYPINLEVEMRNEVIRQKYSSYITSYKPPFSSKVVYETSVGGSKMRFKEKGQALVYVASIVGQQASLVPANQALPPPLPSDEFRG